MSKLYRKPVEVRLVGEALAAFLWRGKWRLVEAIKKVHVLREHSDPYRYMDTYRVTRWCLRPGSHQGGMDSRKVLGLIDFCFNVFVYWL